ncbi:MAG: hypothetical protein ACO1N0_10760 [Fluviicola sp.]
MVEILKINEVFGKQIATILISDQTQLTCGTIISKDGNHWKINGIIMEIAGGEKTNKYFKNNIFNNIWECELVPIDHQEELLIGEYLIKA